MCSNRVPHDEQSAVVPGLAAGCAAAPDHTLLVLARTEDVQPLERLLPTVTLGLATCLLVRSDVEEGVQASSSACLVVDAYGDPKVTAALAVATAAPAVPMIVVDVTSGALCRLPSRGGGCWTCSQLQRAPASVTAHPDGLVRTQLLAWAAALATTILHGDDRSLADMYWLTLETAEPGALPVWRSADLPQHPHCERHASRPPFEQLALLS